MYSKQKIFLIFGLLLFSNILPADELAIKRFQTALSACERALQMDMPKSQGSLKILQSLLKRYQRNKKFALELDGTLKDSTEHHYSGEFFKAETFKQALKTCESQLPTKINEAEKVVSEKTAARKNKQKEQEEMVEALVEKIEIATQQLKIAVDENCMIYAQMIMQETGGKTAPPKAKITSLHQGYIKAKKKAIEIYPDITKRFYVATVVDPFTAEEQQESKAVVNWFKYCEELFAEHMPADSSSAVVGPRQPEEIPRLEGGENSVVPSKIEEESPVEEIEAERETVEEQVVEETMVDAVATDEPAEEELTDEALAEEAADEDYRKIVATLRKDKAKILKENNRLPDHVDNSDFQAATIWQYADDDKCTIYQFRDDKLIRTRVVPGECPAP